LNRVSADRLQELLYLSPGIAQSIVLYRKQQGAFERVADLKKLILISDTMYQRISPLLEIKQP
jgi:DNA uptake protein ComE-like DNA-binding protein